MTVRKRTSDIIATAHVYARNRGRPTSCKGHKYGAHPERHCVVIVWSGEQTCTLVQRVHVHRSLILKGAFITCLGERRWYLISQPALSTFPNIIFHSTGGPLRKIAQIFRILKSLQRNSSSPGGSRESTTKKLELPNI